MNINPVANKPFIDKRLNLQWIESINGWGVFTNQFIQKDEIIEISPLIIYPAKITDMLFWLLQAEGVRSESFTIDRYMIKWDSSSAIPLGWCGLYNHSDNNNAIFKANIDLKCIEIHTIKDISPNEQCLVNYGPEWFDVKRYVEKINL